MVRHNNDIGYTIRSDFPEQLPATQTLYCWHCHAPGAERHDGERITYSCSTCGRKSERVLAYNPGIRQHFGRFDLLLHERCGVFIRREDGKILVYQRKGFPFLLTIPVAHLEVGERPGRCAARAAEEAVGIRLPKPTKIFEGRIVGDSCQTGADIHYWHAYLCNINDPSAVSLGPEGASWGWYEPSYLMSMAAEATEWAVINLLSRWEVRERVDKDWTYTGASGSA
jgi:ADP-ribose pyrophosphatase YjhB (NUDIX family)